MKRRSVMVLLFMVGLVVVHAQSKTTVETKVILAVEGVSEGISHITLFNTFEKMKGKEIFRKYPNCQFYIGLLQGRYEVKEDGVLPSRESTIIMYTDRQYLSGNTRPSIDGFMAGDQVDLGTGKAKVASNKKGELILKIQ